VTQYISVIWNATCGKDKWISLESHYLPKGVATINQFISSSLKSTFHSLTKGHPVLSGEVVSSNANWYCNRKKMFYHQTHTYQLHFVHLVTKGPKWTTSWSKNNKVSHITTHIIVEVKLNKDGGRGCLTIKQGKSSFSASLSRIKAANPQNVYLYRKQLSLNVLNR
jgi:hypothetical protein